MNHTACPLSYKKINSYEFRMAGAFYTILLTLFLLSGKIFIIVYLLGDVAMRLSFVNNSPILFLSKMILKWIHYKKQMEDDAPKRFALILGAVMLMIILSTNLYSLETISWILSVNLIILKLLDVIFNYCVGCKLYQFITIFYSKLKGIL
ncbi:MAG: DUF4395 domain-containing protein [Sulfurovum sp.]|nr:MAG: DUF4395 domain-containing protein [Sulfurovum sp.]